MDVPTGTYELGPNGESILNAGLSGLTGIAARPNAFKTALAVYLMAMVRRACHEVPGVVYDSEGTLYPVQRFSAVSRFDEYLKTIDWQEDTQYAFTDLSQYTGDEWFSLFRGIVNEKPKNEKDHIRTTPFLDPKGKPRKALYPTIALIDSFSKFQVTAAEEIYKKNNIGDSGANTVDMMNGKAKNQMLNQIPQICARTGTYLIMTAHLGDVINMDMFPTDKRNLSHMRRDTTLKGVSPGFYALPNNVWQITGTKPLQNREKMPEYPWDNSTAIQGDTDLTLVTMINLRGKSGLSGVPIDLIFTQSEGLQASLSEFHFCKENGRWGLGGNLQNYFMELLPDVKLSRTTVRRKLDGDYALRRAVQISAELLQIHQWHRTIDPDLLCEPKTLYDDLKEMGYDWNLLLGETRSYWVFEEDVKQHPLKFLSTMDLLRMRKGLYVPYWFSAEQKKQIKSPKAGAAVEETAP